MFRKVYCKQEVVAGPWLPSKKTKRPNLLDAEIFLTEIKNAVFAQKIIIKVQVKTRFAQKYSKPLLILFHHFFIQRPSDSFLFNLPKF